MTTMMDKLVAALDAELARLTTDDMSVIGSCIVPLQNGTILYKGRIERPTLIRAVLTALKEPTEEMVAAAWWDHEEKGILAEEYSVSRCKGDPAHDTAGQVWQAMIEEAGK